MDNPLTWIAIGIAGALTAMTIMQGKVDIEKEKTKQSVIQLEIAQVQAGVTNTPTE